MLSPSRDHPELRDPPSDYEGDMDSENDMGSEEGQTDFVETAVSASTQPSPQRSQTMGSTQPANYPLERSKQTHQERGGGEAAVVKDTAGTSLISSPSPASRHHMKNSSRSFFRNVSSFFWAYRRWMLQFGVTLALPFSIHFLGALLSDSPKKALKKLLYGSTAGGQNNRKDGYPPVPLWMKKQAVTFIRWSVSRGILAVQNCFGLAGLEFAPNRSGKDNKGSADAGFSGANVFPVALLIPIFSFTVWYIARRHRPSPLASSPSVEEEDEEQQVSTARGKNNNSQPTEQQQEAQNFPIVSKEDVNSTMLSSHHSSTQVPPLRVMNVNNPPSVEARGGGKKKQPTTNGDAPNSSRLTGRSVVSSEPTHGRDYIFEGLDEDDEEGRGMPITPEKNKEKGANTPQEEVEEWYERPSGFKVKNHDNSPPKDSPYSWRAAAQQKTTDEMTQTPQSKIFESKQKKEAPSSAQLHSSKDGQFYGVTGSPSGITPNPSPSLLVDQSTASEDPIPSRHIPDIIKNFQRQIGGGPNYPQQQLQPQGAMDKTPTMQKYYQRNGVTGEVSTPPPEYPVQLSAEGRSALLHTAHAANHQKGQPGSQHYNTSSTTIPSSHNSSGINTTTSSYALPQAQSSSMTSSSMPVSTLGLGSGKLSQHLTSQIQIVDNEEPDDGEELTPYSASHHRAASSPTEFHRGVIKLGLVSPYNTFDLSALAAAACKYCANEIIIATNPHNTSSVSSNAQDYVIQTFEATGGPGLSTEGQYSSALTLAGCNTSVKIPKITEVTNVAKYIFHQEQISPVKQGEQGEQGGRYPTVAVHKAKVGRGVELHEFEHPLHAIYVFTKTMPTGSMTQSSMSGGSSPRSEEALAFAQEEKDLAWCDYHVYLSSEHNYNSLAALVNIAMYDRAVKIKKAYGLLHQRR